jgi:hypothetical protein
VLLIFWFMGWFCFDGFFLVVGCGIGVVIYLCGLWLFSAGACVVADWRRWEVGLWGVGERCVCSGGLLLLGLCVVGLFIGLVRVVALLG